MNPDRAPGLDRRSAAILVVLLALCWLVYGGNEHHRLLHWDDTTYVSSNPWVADPSLAHVRELFTGMRLQNWHPLTWLSYIPEYAICGVRAACFKATNIALHAANAFLVYWLCLLVLARVLRAQALKHVQLTAAFAAALFVVHPQHVESVIWIAERKDLLCGFFFLLAMITYLRQHAAENPRPSALPFLFFVLAAMSKSMAITLPAVLVVLDFRPLGRFRNADARTVFRIGVVEKLHFHAIALAVLLVTLYSQEVGAIEQPPLMQRLAIASSALWHYVASFVWPVSLSPFYPASIAEQGMGKYPLAFALGTVLIIAMVARAGGRNAIAFLAYFVVTLIPVIGLMKVGEQAFADRYTYLPMVGWYVLVAWLLAAALSRFVTRPAFAMVTVLVVALLLPLGVLARAYKETWRDDHALWSHVAAHYPDASATVHNNFGNSLYERGNYLEAIAEYERAAAVEPRRVDVYANMAQAYERLGLREDALRAYERGVDADSRNVWARIDAAEAYERRGRISDAIRQYVAALEIDPANADSAFGLGKAMLIAGQAEQAVPLLKALPLTFPRHLDAQLLLAQAYLPSSPGRAAEVLDEAERRYGASTEITLLRKRIDDAAGR